MSGPAEDPEGCEAIVDALAGRGWCVVSGFLSPAEVEGIRREAQAIEGQGGFKPAGVGRAGGLAIRPEIRADRVHWIDPRERGPAVGVYLDRLEGLRQAANRALYLGLFDFECHLALYPPGSFYRRHLDRHRGVELRTLTAVLYLNPDWQAGDGGQLRLYTDPRCPDLYQDVVPVGGTLATFLSADFEHEVLPATRERLSLTGWFRRRA